MTTKLPTLLRADAPWTPPPYRGFFPYAATRLTGLTPYFWLLAIYMFLALSFIDEHYPSIGDARPRFLLGVVLLAVTVGTGIARSVQEGRALSIRWGTSIWLLAFILATSFSALWAFDFPIAKEEHIRHLTTIVSYFLIINIVQTRRQLLFFLLIVCAAVGLYMVISVREFYGGRMDFQQGVPRMLGAGLSNADPNSFGASIVFAMPIMIWVLVHTSSIFIRICATGYMLGSLFCVFKTSSRSALILTVLTLLWSFMIVPKGWPRRIMLAAIVGLGIALVGTLSPAQLKRVASVADSQTYESDASTVGRIDGYKVGFEIFKDNPVLGVGPGNWTTYRVRRVDGDKLMPHNLVGHALATRGFLGTLTFFGFLISAVLLGWREMRRRKRRGTAWDIAVAKLCFTLIFTLGLLFVSGLGAHNLERSNWYWVPALLVVAVSCRSEERRALERLDGWEPDEMRPT